MGPAMKASASIGALALLLAGGCAVGEPVVDRAPIVPPPPVPVSRCLIPSKLCSLPIEGENSAVAARALRGAFCVPSDGDGGIVDGDALANCDEPAVDAGWRSADVLVRADEPREVVVSGAGVFNMRIRLDGPVTLVLRELTKLTNVELVTTSSEATVVFDDVMGVQVTIGDTATPFAGHVVARHSRFDNLSMVAESFELDSVMITQSFVSTDFMNSGDGVFLDVVLELGDALFAPSRLDLTEIVSCRTLAFFGGVLTSTIVPRCESDEPTRLHDAVVGLSILDGLIVGDGGSLNMTQLGRLHPSEYVFWRVVVTDKSMFCDQALRLRSTDNIRCSDCTEGAFGAGQANTCNLEEPEEEEEKTRNNLCEALDLRDQCTAPLPDRMRPIAGFEL